MSSVFTPLPTEKIPMTEEVPEETEEEEETIDIIEEDDPQENPEE